MKVDLLVRNQKDDFICSVVTSDNDFGPKLLISSYSKDFSLMRNDNGPPTVYPASVADEKEFIRFSKYLLERKKVKRIL